MSIRDFIDDTARSVAFLSRVPMPQRHFIGYDGRLSRAVRASPSSEPSIRSTISREVRKAIQAACTSLTICARALATCSACVDTLARARRISRNDPGDFWADGVAASVGGARSSKAGSGRRRNHASQITDQIKPAAPMT